MGVMRGKNGESNQIIMKGIYREPPSFVDIKNPNPRQGITNFVSAFVMCSSFSYSFMSNENLSSFLFLDGGGFLPSY